MIKVFSWNVLTSGFYGPGEYPTYDSKCFDVERKRKQVLEIIKDRICSDYIIVLYEVCDHLRSELIKIAFDLEYQVRDAYYGTAKSKNMGVVMMFPMEYRLIEYEHIVVGQHISKDYKDKTWWEWFTRQNPNKSIENAKSRKNVMLVATLCHKGIHEKMFTISCYHMPCAFFDHKIMKYHLETVFDLSEDIRFRNFNYSNPLIICTDMNTTPDDPLYNYLYTKEMISGMAKDDVEPKFTTNTQTRFNNEPFKKTIDYIWVTKNLLNKVIRKLPTDITGLLPNDEFPSDHYWLDVELDYTHQTY